MLRVVFAGLLALCLAASASASPAYRAFAEKLVAGMPKGMKLRPDLEKKLDAMADAARRKQGRTPLASSDLLRTAARAQAIEMAKGDYVGHQSASGYQFKHRFAAFADPDFYGDHGENAARDRQPGEVDATKASRLFRQWLDSSAHKRNLMNPAYAFVSTGAIQMGHHLYAVQIFWEKSGEGAPAPGEPSLRLGHMDAVPALWRGNGLVVADAVLVEIE